MATTPMQTPPQVQGQGGPQALPPHKQAELAELKAEIAQSFNMTIELIKDGAKRGTPKNTSRAGDPKHNMSGRQVARANPDGNRGSMTARSTADEPQGQSVAMAENAIGNASRHLNQLSTLDDGKFASKQRELSTLV